VDLPRGFGPFRGSLNLADVGSVDLREEATRQTWPSVGDQAKHLAMKSSTMKGAKALVGKLGGDGAELQTMDIEGTRALLASACGNRTSLVRKRDDGGSCSSPVFLSRRVLLVAT
jgi:hypothetical protein